MGAYYYISAIDRALRSNQVKAVETMTKYICTYQNNFTSSYLFKKNLPIFLEKGIECFSLLNSEVFSRNFDFDEWPSSHTNEETAIRPYNGSMFAVRHAYKNVFHEEEYNTIEEQNEEAELKYGKGVGVIENSKIFKIKYSINILPGVGERIVESADGKEHINEDVGLMGLLNGTEELEIFDTKSVQELIEFKWDSYALTHHLIGCFLHFFYLIILMIYINIIYIKNTGTPDEKKAYVALLAVGVLYPQYYNIARIFKQGLEYFY